jgi:sulfite reductase beta subunit-like hemoprotein
VNGCMNYCSAMRSAAVGDNGTSSTTIGLIVGGVTVVVFAATLAGYMLAKSRKARRARSGAKE